MVPVKRKQLDLLSFVVKQKEARNDEQSLEPEAPKVQQENSGMRTDSLVMLLGNIVMF